jgi:hypothetical protein
VFAPTHRSFFPVGALPSTPLRTAVAPYVEHLLDCDACAVRAGGHAAVPTLRRRRAVLQSPAVLMVAVQSMIAQGGARGAGDGLKLQFRLVDYGELRLPLRGDDRHVTYDLVGVVVHAGETVATGHYTAWRRERGGWHFCDDAFVRAGVPLPDGWSRAATPHLLVFARRGAREKAPAPPLIAPRADPAPRRRGGAGVVAALPSPLWPGQLQALFESAVAQCRGAAERDLAHAIKVALFFRRVEGGRYAEIFRRVGRPGVEGRERPFCGDPPRGGGSWATVESGRHAGIFR